MGILGDEVERWAMPFEAPFKSHPLKAQCRTLLRCFVLEMSSIYGSQWGLWRRENCLRRNRLANKEAASSRNCLGLAGIHLNGQN